MLWCSVCCESYEEGTELCPVCGGGLAPAPEAVWGMGKDEPAWPTDAGGVEETPVLLTNVRGSQLDFEMTVSLLSAFGIPTRRGYPHSGELVRLLFGVTGGGMDIFVPESMLEAAQDVLRPVD